MEFAVRKLAPNIGAEVTGLDLSQPFDDPTMARLRQVWLEHVVVVLPGQEIDDDQQIAFSRRIGELELINMSEVQLDGKPEIYCTTNIGDNGELLPKDHPVMQFNKGNMKWHSDSSFKTIPAMASLLRAIEVPPVGADTCFANMAAAYEAVSEEMKARIDGLVGIHSFHYSRRDIDNVVMDQDEVDLIPPVEHPVVRTHPETGLKALYVGAHTAGIVGMSDAEARPLIDGLIEFATGPDFSFTHKWHVGDIVWWDNRAAVHRGTEYEINTYRRRLHRTTVAGFCPVV